MVHIVIQSPGTQSEDVQVYWLYVRWRADEKVNLGCAIELQNDARKKHLPGLGIFTAEEARAMNKK